MWIGAASAVMSLSLASKEPDGVNYQLKLFFSTRWEDMITPWQKVFRHCQIFRIIRTTSEHKSEFYLHIN